MEKGEIGRGGEAGSENAVFNHGEVRGRNQNGVVLVIFKIHYHSHCYSSSTLVDGFELESKIVECVFVLYSEKKGIKSKKVWESLEFDYWDSCLFWC